MIGTMLKDLRISKRITQTDLANILGIKQSTISSWEINRTQATLEQLVSVANYFDVSTDYLLGRIPSQKSTVSFNNTNNKDYNNRNNTEFIHNKGTDYIHNNKDYDNQNSIKDFHCNDIKYEYIPAVTFPYSDMQLKIKQYLNSDNKSKIALIDYFTNLNYSEFLNLLSIINVAIDTRSKNISK